MNSNDLNRLENIELIKPVEKGKLEEVGNIENSDEVLDEIFHNINLEMELAMQIKSIDKT